MLETINRKYIIGMIGFGTFFFGFFAGAAFSFYLNAIHSAMFGTLRTSLQFKSAIFGDGIILPIANMFAASFLINQKKMLNAKLIKSSILLGLAITVYFHLNQALNNLINWAMPMPWHWNFLGLWHAVYMFSVSTFLSMFYLTVFRFSKTRKRVPREFWIVTVSLVLFSLLLHLDYLTVSLNNVFFR
jgi:hypothetical protein